MLETIQNVIYYILIGGMLKIQIRMLFTIHCTGWMLKTTQNVIYYTLHWTDA